MRSPINQCDGLEAFLDGRLEVENRRRFEIHLAGCDECREAAKAWDAVKKEYKGWVEQVTAGEENQGKRTGAPEFVASLLESLEDERTDSRAPRPPWRTILRVAAAATVLAGLSGTIYFMAHAKKSVSNRPAVATSPSRSLTITATIIADGVKTDDVIKGGSKNIIKAPGNGRVVAKVGQDRFGLDRSGEMLVSEVIPDQTAVRLIRGRAAFGVSPRSVGSRFIVKAQDVKVMVVGTRFFVAMDTDHTVTVCVEEGHVLVSAEDWRIRLEAGRSVTVAGGVASPIRAASAQEVGTVTDLLSDNDASDIDRDDAAMSRSPSTDIPGVLQPKDVERREKQAQPQKNIERWRDLIVGGEAQEAETEIRAYLRDSANDVESLMLLANCQKRQGRFQDAVETYKRIIASGDDRFANRARYLAAELSYSKLGDLRGAVELLDDYLNYTQPSTPNRADARLMQAEALLGIGASSRARRVLQEIVADYGRTPIANRARELLGQLLEEMENPK